MTSVGPIQRLFLMHITPHHCIYKHRDRQINDIVQGHKHTHAEHTRTPLSCGGDECDTDSHCLRI
jgi:hypothetical protein